MATLTLSDRLTGAEKCETGLTGLNSQAGERLNSGVRRGRYMVHRRSAERLLDLCCANRGTFIKVGQHLGALDYLLPEEYTSTLKVLHSRAPQSSMEQIQQVIREDLGKESVFWIRFRPRSD
ncbi:unnamed protein product [Pleuronectes platessa]|uniref:Uncharacterized protein n=1 Tax=Pleuronectes platessa TaxID=8262 RepID=A0A9N7UJ47_PLEPL|nr:unnamed protein product [Pleuronectes platessa]